MNTHEDADTRTRNRTSTRAPVGLTLLALAALLAPAMTAGATYSSDTDGLLVEPPAGGDHACGFQTFNCGEATLSGYVGCYYYVTYWNCNVEYTANAVATNWLNPGSFTASITGWCSTSQPKSWIVLGEATTFSCNEWVIVDAGDCITPSARLTVRYDGLNAPRNLIVSKNPTVCPV